MRDIGGTSMSTTASQPAAAPLRCPQAHPRPQRSRTTRRTFAVVPARRFAWPGRQSLLARPHDPRDPRRHRRRQRAVRHAFGLSDCSSSVLAVRRFSSLHHHSPPVVFTTTRSPRADRRARRHHDDVAVAVGRLHLHRRKFPAHKRARHRRWAAPPRPSLCRRDTRCRRNGRRGCRLRKAEQRHRLPAPRAIADQLHEGIDRSCWLAASALDTDLGRRPAFASIRRDALGFVEGGRVEAGALGRAPKAIAPARSASRSSAVQTWPWVSMRGASWRFGHARSLCRMLGIITSIDPVLQSGARVCRHRAECRLDVQPRAADTVGADPRSRKIPRDSTTKQGMPGRAHDLQNLSRLGLARGRAARRVPGQRRRCPRWLHSFLHGVAGRGDRAKAFLRARPDCS